MPASPRSNGSAKRRAESAPHDAPANIEVHLLGAPQWVAGGGVPVDLNGPDASLLAKLALDGPQGRWALCALIWPASSPKQAHDSLRQRASRFLKAAGTELIDAHDVVRLGPAVTVDVSRLDILPTEVLMTTPGLLAGVDVGDRAELDSWVTEARKRVSERCAGILTTRADALEHESQLPEALRVAMRVVELNPTAEPAWQRVMRLQYLMGAPGTALSTYERLRDTLRIESGRSPSTESQRLLQTISAAEPMERASPGPVPASLMRPPVLVGRHAQWSAMASAWAEGRAFLLLGEAGIGKTRLLEEFVRGQAGLVIDRAPAEHGDAAWALLGRLVLKIEQQYRPRVTSAVRAEMARVQAQMSKPPGVPGNEATLRQAMQTWLSAALSAGLQGIVVDDLHNSDVASLEALQWMAASAELKALRIGLASRPPRPGEAGHTGRVGRAVMDWLAQPASPLAIELPKLAHHELMELLASLALPALLDKSLVQRLFTRAGGQPLYTLATLQQAMKSRGALEPEQVLPVPAPLSALLEARLRELPNDCVPVVQIAAVGGTDLTLDRVARLMQRSPLEMGPLWASLEAHDVLRGESFSHDLMHDAALRSVPQGVKQSLHRQWAALLADEPGVPPARLAHHWEEGTRACEAGAAWYAAASAARVAGRLGEQTDFFERAARCHAQAGNRGARLDALLARLDGLHLQHGPAAVLEALPEVQGLATTSLEHLRCRLIHAEALFALGRASDAAAQAQAALAETEHHPQWTADVLAQLAMAQAHLGQSDEALANAERAVAAARGNGSLTRLLRTHNALMNVHWSAGRLRDALRVQRDELACAEKLLDQATAAASEGSGAALLAAIGDVPATHACATRARKRQQDAGFQTGSVQVILNHTVLGAAAAALGRFDEALQALSQALATQDADVPGALGAKVRLTLASVWLTLGRADRVHEVLQDVPQDCGLGMQLQTQWLLGRAAMAAGASPSRHWQRFRDLQASLQEPALVQSVDFEASYIDDAASSIGRLSQARSQFAALGMDGTARALAWRELVRWLELPGEQADHSVRALALELRPYANAGLSAKCYPPQTWLTLAQAYERLGDGAERAACIAAGRKWIDDASARLAPEHRARFRDGNAVNRVLLTNGALK
jgi:DNA-binding SARP family transcriptional activator/tetratricopeptide (TPR) repeat protein